MLSILCLWIFINVQAESFSGFAERRFWKNLQKLLHETNFTFSFKYSTGLKNLVKTQKYEELVACVFALKLLVGGELYCVK